MSRRVLPTTDCLAHHGAIAQALQALEAALREVRVEPHDHATPESFVPGSLRYTQLTVERSSSKVQLVLVWSAATAEEVPLLGGLATRLWQQTNAAGGPLWHSIWAHFRKPEARTRAIFAEPSGGGDDSGNDPEDSRVNASWQCLYGDAVTQETICGLPFKFGPATFQQPNLETYEHIIQDIKLECRGLFLQRGSAAAVVKGHPRIMELCGGVGVLGLSLLAELGSSASLLCTELNPGCRKPFELNVHEILGHQATDTDRVAFHAAEMHDALELFGDGGFNIVVANPPRRGLGPDVVRRLAAMRSLKALIYMSCGHRSFRMDAEHLMASGFRLTSLNSYDSFPDTEHIEILGTFTRTSAVGHWYRHTKAEH